jgi:hypothetical protein
MSDSWNRVVVLSSTGVEEAVMLAVSVLLASYQSCDGLHQPPLLSCQ